MRCALRARWFVLLPITGFLLMAAADRMFRPATDIHYDPLLAVDTDPPATDFDVNPQFRSDPLLTTDLDAHAGEFDTNINYNVDRRARIAVPGTVSPSESPKEPVGISAPPYYPPAPGKYSNKGQGGALEGLVGNTSTSIGEVGGYGLRANAFLGRSGATQERSLREGGGSGTGAPTGPEKRHHATAGSGPATCSATATHPRLRADRQCRRLRPQG